MVRSFACILLIAAASALVASGQECDCDAFVKCKTDGKEAKMSAKKACAERCTTKSASDPDSGKGKGGKGKGGKGKGGKGKDGKGKGRKGRGRKGKGGKGKGGKGKGGGNPFRRIMEGLNDAQKASVEQYSTCLQQCRAQKPEPTAVKGESCRKQFPSCSVGKRRNRDEFKQAVEACGGGAKGKGKRKERRSEVCNCLADELKISAILCSKKHGKGKSRVARAALASGSAGSFELQAAARMRKRRNYPMYQHRNYGRFATKPPY